MENLTPQQVFDKAVSGVLAQGKQSVGPNGGCMYRAPDGCKCAAGQVLPDDLYDPDIEGGSVLDDAAAPVFEDICTEKAVVVLYCLQGTHDQKRNWYEGTKSMAEAFQNVARNFGLDDAMCLPYLDGAGG